MKNKRLEEMANELLDRAERVIENDLFYAPIGLHMEQLTIALAYIGQSKLLQLTEMMHKTYDDPETFYPLNIMTNDGTQFSFESKEVFGDYIEYMDALVILRNKMQELGQRSVNRKKEQYSLEDTEPITPIMYTDKSNNVH